MDEADENKHWDDCIKGYEAEKSLLGRLEASYVNEDFDVGTFYHEKKRLHVCPIDGCAKRFSKEMLLDYYAHIVSDHTAE